MNKFIESLDLENPVELEDFQVLNDCHEFYNLLVDFLDKSQEAYIATLYFGSSGCMSTIWELLEKRKKNSLYTKILLDRNKSNRDQTDAEINRRGLSSMFFYIDPSYIQGIPSKIKELLRVFHTKALVFDDCVILTGANMDDTNFTSRMDR